MDAIESHTYSFVIRIWMEEAPTNEKAGTWRGYITHVNSADQRYLQSLEDIIAYIVPYLEAWGMNPGV